MLLKDDTMPEPTSFDIRFRWHGIRSTFEKTYTVLAASELEAIHKAANELEKDKGIIDGDIVSINGIPNPNLGPELLPPEILTVQEVFNEVARITTLKHDPEAAHIAEDKLHQKVLRAIAVDCCEDPAKCAQIALATTYIKFGRHCA